MAAFSKARRQPLAPIEHLLRWESRCIQVTGGLIEHDRVDFDPVPYAKLTDVSTTPEPVPSCPPRQGARLTVHRDRSKITPITLETRFWQGRCVGTPIGEQVHREDAQAFGFGGAATGHAAIICAAGCIGESTIPGGPDFPGAVEGGFLMPFEVPDECPM